MSKYRLLGLCDIFKFVIGPTYFVVRFIVDETVCIVPQKKIMSPAIPSVGDSYEVKWSSGEILTATVLATGESLIHDISCLLV